MKTVLVEPLSIKEELLMELSKPLGENGNIFEFFETKPKTEEDWLNRTKDADQIILANTKMPETVINSNKLKYINIAFTGTDHVPVDEAKEKGIIVSNAAGYSDTGVAELVIGMTLNILRDIKDADQAVRNFEGSDKFLGREINGKTVGIIGTGKIGLRTAEMFKVFGADLIGYNRSESEKGVALGITYKSLEDVMKESDIITIHLPLNSETKDIIGYDELSLMKESAIIINCARGPIINSEALVKILENKKIYGAGIDVFDTEPPLDESEPILKTENTILTPHIAFFTEESMEKRARIVFENAIDFINGKKIKTEV